MVFFEEVQALIAREMVDPENRALQAAVRALDNGKFDREIVATKGHPHGRETSRLMDERVARGERPDGSGR